MRHILVGAFLFSVCALGRSQDSFTDAEGCKWTKRADGSYHSCREGRLIVGAQVVRTTVEPWSSGLFKVDGVQAPLIPNGPPCTEQGWYQDPRGSWRFRSVPKAGDIIPSGLDAHSLGIYGSDGVIYWVCDQCRNVPPETHCDLWPGLYKKPDDALALAFWNTYYVTNDPAGNPPPAAIKNHGHDGDPAKFAAHFPQGTQHYNLFFIGQIPDPPRATLMAAQGCTAATSTPTKTPVPTTPTRTPTPAPNQFARQIEAAARAQIMVGCGGGMFCPKSTLNREQMAAIVVQILKLPLLPCEQTFSDVLCAP